MNKKKHLTIYLGSMTHETLKLYAAEREKPLTVCIRDILTEKMLEWKQDRIMERKHAEVQSSEEDKANVPELSTGLPVVQEES